MSPATSSQINLSRRAWVYSFGISLIYSANMGLEIAIISRKNILCNIKDLLPLSQGK